MFYKYNVFNVDSYCPQYPHKFVRKLTVLWGFLIITACGIIKNNYSINNETFINNFNTNQNNETKNQKTM